MLVISEDLLLLVFDSLAGIISTENSFPLKSNELIIDDSLSEISILSCKVIVLIPSIFSFCDSNFSFPIISSCSNTIISTLYVSLLFSLALEKKLEKTIRENVKNL